MFEELQTLSDANKKRILIIGTIIIMVIVIGVWFIYFNSVIIGTSSPAAPSVATTTAPVPAVVAPSAPSSTPSQASGPGAWQDIKNFFGSIANIFRKPSQYNIQPQSN